MYMLAGLLKCLLANSKQDFLKHRRRSWPQTFSESGIVPSHLVVVNGFLLESQFCHILWILWRTTGCLVLFKANPDRFPELYPGLVLMALNDSVCLGLFTLGLQGTNIFIMKSCDTNYAEADSIPLITCLLMPTGCDGTNLRI